MQVNQMNFDWYRKKDTQVKKRGNLMLVVPSPVSRDGKTKTRCIWPSQFETDYRYLSLSIWGRSSES